MENNGASGVSRRVAMGRSTAATNKSPTPQVFFLIGLEPFTTHGVAFTDSTHVSSTDWLRGEWWIIKDDEWIQSEEVGI